MDDLERLAVQGIQQSRGTGRNVGSKTADEMFRELGYRWEGTTEGSRIYEMAEYADAAVKVNPKYVDYFAGSQAMRVETPLILACAQLIREMEVDNGRKRH